jgi:hypothetical protein
MLSLHGTPSLSSPPLLRASMAARPCSGGAPHLLPPHGGAPRPPPPIPGRLEKLRPLEQVATEHRRCGRKGEEEGGRKTAAPARGGAGVQHDGWWSEDAAKREESQE